MGRETTQNSISRIYEDIEKITINKEGDSINAFWGFVLISIGIEFLGAVFDEYEWDDRLSELRFRLAISKLFDKRYHKFNSKKHFDLYRCLRCPMIHQIRPGKGICISERSDPQIKKFKLKHLSVWNGSLILIYEDFLADFKGACDSVIKMITDKKLLSEKAYSERIAFSE